MSITAVEKSYLSDVKFFQRQLTVTNRYIDSLLSNKKGEAHSEWRSGTQEEEQEDLNKERPTILLFFLFSGLRAVVFPECFAAQRNLMSVRKKKKGSRAPETNIGESRLVCSVSMDRSRLQKTLIKHTSP